MCRRNRISRVAGASLLLAAAVLPVHAGQGSLAPYPPAASGQQRYVIHLEAQPDESLRQVELLVGKTMQVDCNRHGFIGKLEQQTVAGWGYPYVTVSGIGGPASTMMACPQDSNKQAFVTLGGGPHWVRYNSKLPVVVYVPEGFEVRYRLWSASKEALPASLD